MAELSGVVRAINDLVVRIERFNDPSEIGSVVLRSDYITKMLVNLDVADDIVNTMSCLHETVLAIEADSSSPVGQGYRTQLNRAGRRGWPSFDKKRELLSCLSEQGLKVKECSDLFGVGQRTVERSMTSFGPSVSGERFSVLFYSFDCILYIF